MKTKKVILSVIVILLAGFYFAFINPAVILVIEGVKEGKESQKKVEKFINLPASEHERLIGISKQFHSEVFDENEPFMTYSTNSALVLANHDYEFLPQDFVAFGFYEVSLEKNGLKGRLYHLFDSGGEVVIDWSNPDHPTIEIVQGDCKDIIRKVYPRTIE